MQIIQQNFLETESSQNKNGLEIIVSLIVGPAYNIC